MVSQDRWSLVTDRLRFICSGKRDLLQRICGPSRQVVCHGSGLLRQVSVYLTTLWNKAAWETPEAINMMKNTLGLI